MVNIKRKNFKKLIIGLLLSITMIVSLFSGCIGNNGDGKNTGIVVISRESTSGTREFFYENVLNKEDFYEKSIEKTSNGEVHDTVATTELAIGYVGLGYLDPQVKAIKVDGIEATVANILSGDYPIARELYMFTKDNATGLAKEFLDFLMSPDGQLIIEEEGFVPLQGTEAYNSTGKQLSGTLEISGSTTVLPIGLAAVEVFMNIFPDLTINVNGGGSGAGISAVSQGIVNIGMASRDLKDTEQSLGLVKYTICSDGIAIIVHPSNNYIENNDLTMEQLKSIYIGQITNWIDL